VTHCIFDMDGLLLDSNRLYLETTKAILAKHGKQIDPVFHPTTLGRRHQENSPIIIAHYGLPYTPDEFTQLYREILVPKLASAAFMPGAERLLKHLAANNVPMALATSSTKEGFKAKTARHKEVFKLFSHIVTGSDPDVKCGKPAPDIFQLAAARFSPPADPASCLVFEDAPNGAEAAHLAGMQCVLIPDGDHFGADVASRSATQFIASLREFRPQDFGLPPF